MTIIGLTVDVSTNAPVVLLRDAPGGRILPIWIGVVEASAIAFELENVRLPRPMTHDLLRDAIVAMQGRVTQVGIVELRDSTYVAQVELEHGGSRHVLDARPSDAIALALRLQAPIFCADKVLDKAGQHEAVVIGADNLNETLGDAAGAQQPIPSDKQAAEAAQQRSDEDRGLSGPQPIVSDGSQPVADLLEKLDTEAFGKYKM